MPRKMMESGKKDHKNRSPSRSRRRLLGMEGLRSRQSAIQGGIEGRETRKKNRPRNRKEKEKMMMMTTGQSNDLRNMSL